jgi:hypothetical protein
MIKVTGNTYQAKDVLKKAGFEYVPQFKAWFGNEEANNELKRITTATYSRANQKATMGLKYETVESYK